MLIVKFFNPLDDGRSQVYRDPKNENHGTRIIRTSFSVRRDSTRQDGPGLNMKMKWTSEPAKCEKYLGTELKMTRQILVWIERKAPHSSI